MMSKLKARSTGFGSSSQKPDAFLGGFTIIELMISTVVFTLLLLICLNALVQISRSYYKGVTSTKTQEAARAIVDEVSQGIQMTADSIYPSNGPAGPQIAASSMATDITGTQGIFCIGTVKYSYSIDRQVNADPSADAGRKQIRNAIIRRNTGATCSSSTTPDNLNMDNLPADYRSLVGDNMRISRLTVAEVPNTNGVLWRVEATVVYGDEDLLRAENGRLICNPNTGDEFCAFSEISTTVKRRVSGVN